MKTKPKAKETKKQAAVKTKKPAARRAKVTSTPARARKRKPAPPPKPKHERHAGGRPSLYTEALGLAVCGWIRQGYTLRQIGSLPNMPDKATIIRWLANHTEFCDHYARAGEVRALLMADEMLEIAEDGKNDWMEREGRDGEATLVPDREAIERSKVRIDARKWLMAKMAPKVYGAKLAVTGKDGGPVQHLHQTVSDLMAEIDGAGTGLSRHGGDNPTD